MIFLAWILLGLLLNYLFWGFDFSTLLCFFAGLFLIMPLLVKLSYQDLKYVFHHPKILLLNLVLNFIIFPLIAFLIGYFFFPDNYYLIISLILLSLIPWGWLLMSWLQYNKADFKLWFSIFAFNLFVFNFVFLAFSLWVDKFVAMKKIDDTNHILVQNPVNKFIGYWNFSAVQNENHASCVIDQTVGKIGSLEISCFGEDDSVIIYSLYWFFILVFFPFLISRFIRSINFLKNFFKKYGSLISKLAAFVIITYIFSLKYIRSLFSLDSILLVKILLAVFLFYLLIFVVSFFFYKILKLEKSQKKAIFWNAFVRFITLWFVFSFLYAISWDYPQLILIFIVAYFFQIWMAFFISRFILK